MDRYLEYERLKRELPKSLTPEQYETAIQELADRLGI